MRLGVFIDSVYRSDGTTFTNSRAFTRFVTSFPAAVEETVVFGRLSPDPGRDAYELPAGRVRFVPLAHYPSVGSVGAMLRATRRSVATFVDELDNLDAVWVFGPHPMAVLLARAARRRGKRLFLGVRQDYPRYVAHRLPSPRWAWAWAVAAAWILELEFRRLARAAPTVVVGDDLARRYGGGGGVLSTGFSLVRDHEVAEPESMVGGSWEQTVSLITVSRLEPEKNPGLLLDVMERLEAAQPGRWRLTIVGDGRLRPALERGVAERNLGGAVELAGEVTNGPGLRELYSRSDAFVHVSLTEGLPQVIYEAQAAGLPIVATAVGGVPSMLRDGAAGMLVPPRDAGAIVEALMRLQSDPAFRRDLALAGLSIARSETMDAQLRQIVDFFAGSSPRPAAALTG